MSDKSKIIEINGLTIKANSVYKVTPKPDSSAPDGFVREGTTKLPSMGIYNGIPCNFKVTNSSTKEGVYDTGFYTQSPTYGTLKDDQKEIIVKNLIDKIVKPYEAKYGRGTLDHDNTEFWDSYVVHLEAGKPYVTSNPDDLLALYIAMSAHEIAPKDKLGDPKFKNAQFCIEDSDKIRTRKEEVNNLVMDSTINFGSLLSNNKSKLLNVLRYIKMIDLHQEYDEATLKSSFYQWINSNNDNPIKFLSAYKLSTNDDTEEIVNLYVRVAKLYKKGVITFTNNEFLYKGTNLGADLKTVANNLNKNKDLEDIKIALLEE